MPNTSMLQQYARVGAAARIKELEQEIGEIRRAFPGLDGAAPPRKRLGRPPGRSKAQTSAPAPQPQAHEPTSPARKRRKLSAAARKAISDAQRKRWARQKAETA